jgi:hypothetical protein
MPKFESNNTIYDIPDNIVQQFLTDNPDAIEVSAEEPGKITPPKEENQGVPVEENVTPEIQPTATELLSEDISSDLQKIKSSFEQGEFTIAQRPAFEEFQKTGEIKQELLQVKKIEEKDPSIAESLAAKTVYGITDFLRGTQAFAEDVVLTTTAGVADVLGNPLSNEEKIGLKSALAQGVPGSTYLSTGQYDNILSDINEHIRKTENTSVTKAIENNNYAEAAELAIGGALQSLPSVAMAFTGAGGLAVFGSSVAGNKFDEEFKNNPEESLALLALNAAGTGATEALFERTTMGLIGKAKGLIGRGSTQEAAKILKEGLGAAGKRFGLGIFKESLSEGATEGANMIVDAITLGKDIPEDAFYRVMDGAIIGGLMGGSINTIAEIGGASTAARNRAEFLLTPEAQQNQMKTAGAKISNLSLDLQKADGEAANIIREEINKETEKIIQIKKANSLNINAMNKEQLMDYAKNIDIINKRKSIKGPDSAIQLANDEIKKLTEENNKIISLAKEQQFEKTAEISKKQAEQLGIDFQSFETKKALEEYLIKNNFSENIIKEAVESDGFISGDGKQIFINKEIAKNTDAVNVASHELLHGLLFKTLKEKPETAINLGRALGEEISKLNLNEIADSNFRRRVELYSKNPESVQAEEILTLFSDATATGDIKYNENIFTRIGDSIRKVLQDLGFKKIKFDTGRDVYNFIKDYNKDISKGGIRQKVLEQARKGIEGKLVDVTKTSQKEVEKFSRSQKASDEVQRIYKEQGTAGAMDIIDQFKPIVDKLVNKYRDVPGFEYELLKDEIETGKRGILDMIMEYTPEKAKGAPLAGYINTFLSRRAIEAANRILKTDFELDVTEAKGVTDTVTTEEIIEEKEVAVADEIKSLRKEIGLSEDLVTKVKDAVVKTFGTKLPNPQDPKFRFELQKRFRTELKKPLSKFVGTRANFENFLRDNFEAIYNKMPQSLINRRFSDFAQPVLDENGKQLRERTAEGNKVFTKKKISKAEWIKYFLGSEVGSSTKGARKTAVVEGMAEEIAFDATMEVLNDPDVISKYQDIAGITGEVLPENFKSLIAKQVDRAEGFKFSKSIINDAKAEYNLESQELAKILNKTSLDKLSDKYSLISDNIIYEADPANIKFSLTTKADGKWEQNQLNPLEESAKLYKFKVGEIDYEINAFKDPSGYNYDIFEQTEGIEDGAINNDPKSWELSFASATTKRVGLTEYALKGRTNQFKVFGTVANATIDLIKKEKLNSITFTAKEESRKRLYNSLNKKFANELGWETYDYPADIPDGSETIFIAYDPKAFPVEEVVNPPQIKFSNSNSKFNVTAKKLLTPEGWAEWSNAKLEGSKILQDEIGDIKTQLGSQRPSYVVSENELKGFDKLKPKEKQILREKIKDLRKSIISYKAKTNFNILKPGESFGNPAEKFGRNAIEIKNNIENGNIFKLQNTYSRVYDSMWEKYYNILEKNPDMFDFLESTLQTSSNDVSHWHRLGAIFLGYDPTALKTFAVDKDGNKKFKTIYAKDGKEIKIPITRTFEYEHAVQNHIQWKRVLNAAKRFAKNKNKKGFLDYLKKSKKDYVLIAISVADSKKINEAGYAHVMPKNWKKWVDRYIASNIDLNKIVNISYSNNNAFIEKNINSIFVQKFSKSLNKEFNKILEESTGVKWTERFSPAKARVMAKGKGKGAIFVPYSADDFVGLLYTTLAGKEKGNQQMDWYRENLLRPFSRGIQAYEAEKQRAMREWSVLKQRAKKDVPGGLKKENESGFTNEQSLRMYMWQKQGFDIPWY